MSPTKKQYGSGAAWAGVIVTLVMAFLQWAIVNRLDSLGADVKSLDRRLSFIEGQLTRNPQPRSEP